MIYERFDITETVGSVDYKLKEEKNMGKFGKFEFLTSTRFWASIITSVSVVLVDPSFPNQLWYVSLGKFLGLVAGQFIIIRTTDRASEQKVLAAGVSSGQVNAEDVTGVPPKE